MQPRGPAARMPGRSSRLARARAGVELVVDDRRTPESHRRDLRRHADGGATHGGRALAPTPDRRPRRAARGGKDRDGRSAHRRSAASRRSIDRPEPDARRAVAHTARGVPRRAAQSIGTITGGRRKPTGTIDIATIQSLARGGQVDDGVLEYGFVVVDECHHVPAVSTEQVLRSIPARYVLGLTATPQRRDGHQPIIRMQCGPTRHTIRTRPDLALRVIRRETATSSDRASRRRRHSGALPAVSPRTVAQRADSAGHARGARRGPLSADPDRPPRSSRTAGRHARSARPAHGGPPRRSATSRAARRTSRARPRRWPDPHPGHRSLPRRGVRPPEARHAAAGPAGRLEGHAHAVRRPPPPAAEGKSDALIYDYVDVAIPMLDRMYAKRERTYRALGYRVDAEPRALTIVLTTARSRAVAIDTRRITLGRKSSSLPARRTKWHRRVRLRFRACCDGRGSRTASVGWDSLCLRGRMDGHEAPDGARPPTRGLRPHTGWHTGSTAAQACPGMSATRCVQAASWASTIRRRDCAACIPRRTLVRCRLTGSFFRCWCRLSAH